MAKIIELGLTIGLLLLKAYLESRTAAQKLRKDVARFDEALLREDAPGTGLMLRNLTRYGI